MRPCHRVSLLRQMQANERGPQLTDRQRVYVDEYTATLDRRAAKAAAGFTSDAHLQDPDKFPAVADAIHAKLVERMQASNLKAEYVREYLLSVLELCPTDYFVLAHDGDWVIAPEAFAELPHEVKRLVERAELKTVQGRTYFRVEFISKQAALAMAAKFTLVQKHDISVSPVPWAEIAGKEDRDLVEEKLRELE